jgi:translocator protein
MGNFLKLIISVCGTLAIGFLGSIVTIPSISTWYTNLIKPSFSPPNWLFGPVWTMLYILMGVSVFLIWRKKTNKNIKAALRLYLIQLGLNFSWSFVFFGLHQPLLAFINILALWIAIIMTIQKFKSISKLASGLLVPYLLWVTFASILNLAIVILNN